MNWMLLPPWSEVVIAIAVVVLVAALVVRTARERRAAPVRRQVIAIIFRMLALAGLLAIALNPTLMEPRVLKGRPTLAVLLDTSGSMAAADVVDQPRIARAISILQEAAPGLAEAFTLDLRRFDESPEAMALADLDTLKAEGAASDLGAALSAVVADLAEKPAHAGVLLISDGRATTAGALDAAELALARSVPLWTCALGGEVSRRDVWVEAEAAETLAFAEAEVELAATVGQIGYDDRSFSVELRCDGEVIKTLEATPGSGGTAHVEATVKAPSEGEARYTFAVPAQAEEAERQNNERSIYVRAVGEKVRVLLVEGAPHWDTKFLVQSLKRNVRVELLVIYRLGHDRQFAVRSAAGREKREEGDLFPRTREALQEYDVIILGRNCEAFFDEETTAQLADFVAEDGGSLVFSRGKPYGGRHPPLAKLDPIVWGDGASGGGTFDPADGADEAQVFEFGREDTLDVVFDRLPHFDRVRETRGVKPLGIVLARQAEPETKAATPDAQRPVVLAYQHYGQGRVVTLNAAGLWRWAFREEGEAADEQVYDRFWDGLLRWVLAGSDFLAGHDVALASDRRLYTDRMPLRFLIRTRGLDAEAYQPRLALTGGSEPVLIEPRRQAGGVYLAEIGPQAPGRYEAVLTSNIGEPKTLTLAVEVASASVENRVQSADPALMARLAEVSEGQVIKASDVADLAAIVERWRSARQLAEQKLTLWDRWWMLAILLAVLGAEWFLRRREGLL